MKPPSAWQLLIASLVPSVVCIAVCAGISALALGIVGNLQRVSIPHYMMWATVLSVSSGWLAGIFLTVAAHVIRVIRDDER